MTSHTSEGRQMDSQEQVGDAYGFEMVDAVLPDPYPPGVDPTSVHLPSVPRIRFADDDAVQRRNYWQAHVWVLLHRYSRVFTDPDCPTIVHDEYPRVAHRALRLVERASGVHPISPLDAVACHTELKDLRKGAVTCEGTLVALRVTPEAGRSKVGHYAGVSSDSSRGPDFFSTATPTRTFDLRLGMRGVRRPRRAKG